MASYHQLTSCVFVKLMLVCLTSQVAYSRNVVHMSVGSNAEKMNMDTTSADTYQLAKHFQSNMVLQRGPSRATIYGFSNVLGGKVIVTMQAPSKVYYSVAHVTASPSPLGGQWSVQLNPMPAGTVVKIIILFPTQTITLGNVIFGDVWLCSGQSNMQFEVYKMFNASEELAIAQNYPNIRLMAAALNQSDTPLYDLVGFRQNWALPSNDTLSPFSAVCWLFGRYVYEATGVPMGMVSSEWGGTPVEAWSSPDALKMCNVTGQTDYNLPKWDQSERGQLGLNGPHDSSVLWNAMINPFLPMTIYGAIWYQGEDDAIKPAMKNRYNCTFPAMIADWRAKFHTSSQQTNSSFPFGFVQLAPDHGNPDVDPGFADIRWHQTADIGFVPNVKMPNVFMAVALDLPDFKSPWGSIHPRDKTDVGLRLSYSGLSVAYNISRDFQGPFPLSGTVVSDQFEINYGSKWTLDIRDAHGFEFLCVKTDGVSSWEATNITAHTSTSVTVPYKVCQEGFLPTPTKLRYNWSVAPCAFKKCAVYGVSNELPAPPFVTDLKSNALGLLTLGRVILKPE